MSPILYWVGMALGAAGVCTILGGAWLAHREYQQEVARGVVDRSEDEDLPVDPQGPH